MANNDDINHSSEKEAAKLRLKRLFREWHPDVVGSARRQNFEIIHVLTELNTSINDGSLSDFRSGWPESILDDAKIDFPSGITINFPETPEAFFEALQKYRDGTLRTEDYPKVTLKRVRSADDGEERKRKLEQDETLDKFWKFVAEADSIETISRAFDLFTLYSEEQLREIGMPALIDKRASFLFTREVWQSNTKEAIDAVVARVHRFPFFDESTRKHVLATTQIRISNLPIQPTEKRRPTIEEIRERRDLERTTRLSFITRIRLTETIEQLRALDAEVQQFNFFNRGELGVVRSVITRKARRLGGLDKS